MRQLRVLRSAPTVRWRLPRPTVAVSANGGSPISASCRTRAVGPERVRRRVQLWTAVGTSAGTGRGRRRSWGTSSRSLSAIGVSPGCGVRVRRVRGEVAAAWRRKARRARPSIGTGSGTCLAVPYERQPPATSPRCAPAASAWLRRSRRAHHPTGPWTSTAVADERSL